MNLPVSPPVAPMLARLVRELPVGDDLQYEPKWDGFRTIVFRDGPELLLASRNERDMTRYFPELKEALAAQLPPRIVLDGEIVIVSARGLDFDALLMRIHPAASRIERLSRETPASFVAFDLLALGQADLRPRPLVERRQRLERSLAGARPPLYLTPASTDPAVAREWFRRFEGAGLDGVIAKPLGLAYVEGRRVMAKLKHERTADCVVAGYREHAQGGVGSLLLGLYDGAGRLHHVGIAAGFAARERRELEKVLAPLRRGAANGHPWLGEESADGPETRRPGGPSRWARERDLAWEPLRPERVAEVRYDHLQGERFRHATQFVRWRPDRDPRSCTYDQLETVTLEDLDGLFARVEVPSAPLKKARDVAARGAARASRDGASATPRVARILRPTRSRGRSRAAPTGGETEMESLQDLFTHEIKDLYSAEKQLVRALPKLAKAAASEELGAAITDHLRETEEQVARLERILEELEASTRGPKCKGMEGLIAEGQEILEDDVADNVIDAALIGAAQRVEHYEIAAYGTARAHAIELNLDNAVKLLQQTLDEESAADEKLTEIAESLANARAVNGDMEAEENGASAGRASSRGSRSSKKKSNGGMRASRSPSARH